MVPFVNGAGGANPAHLDSPGDAWSRGPLQIAGLPLAAELFKIHAVYPERDYLLGTSKGPMAYSTASSHLRRCLAAYTSLDVADVCKFTLHSLKTTPLTWGLQLQLGVEVRAAQGHHRIRNSSGCREIPP